MVIKEETEENNIKEIEMKDVEEINEPKQKVLSIENLIS